ncbi:hypothetical protein Bealeia1_01020 [Candidatus Bealeia paramacronuclearis]|uniref:Uncharacterized protein n=1 Tax=Candidatus Bealeia paramacronuclearis TaxID=1921001 RepID=A0ABZ2C3C5_9PROT|nr:hypothetical protein [Candidatus Bealeia paramacronuclearis]
MGIFQKYLEDQLRMQAIRFSNPLFKSGSTIIESMRNCKDYCEEKLDNLLKKFNI